MTSTPSPNSVRITVSVSPEVHEAFKRLSKAGGMSLSRAVGEWLGDTVEAAEFMATKMEQARAAPGLVMREMHAYAMGLADETGNMIEKIRQKGQADRGGLACDARADSASPPPSNTGGKGTKNNSTSSNPSKAVTPKTQKNEPARKKPKFPMPPALVQAYADTNGVPPRAKS